MPETITLTDAAEGRTLGPVTLATEAPTLENSDQIEAALADLRALISTPKASATIVYGHGTPQICLSSDWPNGKTADIGWTHALPTLAEMLVEARDMIRAWHITRRNDVVRRLALAIIETTDEHTRCTQTLLRAKGFTQPELDKFGDAACARASEMCSPKSFSIEAA